MATIDDVRQRVAQAIATLKPIAESTGPFAHPRDVYLDVVLAVHELEVALFEMRRSRGFLSP